MLVAGCLIAGIGVGLLFDRAGAGTMIGLGVGLVLEYVVGSRRKPLGRKET